MSKFSEVKIGDRLWSLQWNCWGTVTDVRKDEEYPIYYKADIDAFITVDYEGRTHKDGIPMLYWNEVCLPTDEEDKKPFNLIEFLKENLTPKTFEIGEYNYFILYDLAKEEFDYDCEKTKFSLGIIYFDKYYIDATVCELNDQKVTLEEFEEAITQLRWR